MVECIYCWEEEKVLLFLVLRKYSKKKCKYNYGKMKQFGFMLKKTTKADEALRMDTKTNIGRLVFQDKKSSQQISASNINKKKLQSIQKVQIKSKHQRKHWI